MCLFRLLKALIASRNLQDFIKSGDWVKYKKLLLTTVLGDEINLGLTKITTSCLDTTQAKLAWQQAARYIRDETYGAAMAELFNAQCRNTFAEHWGGKPNNHRTVRTSGPAAQPRAPVTLTRSTAAVQDGHSIPTSMTITHLSTPILSRNPKFLTKITNLSFRLNHRGHCQPQVIGRHFIWTTTIPTSCPSRGQT